MKIRSLEFIDGRLALNYIDALEVDILRPGEEKLPKDKEFMPRQTNAVQMRFL